MTQLQRIPAHYLYAAVLFLGTLAAFATIFDEKPDMNGDNLSYLMLGRALADGEGYVYTDGLVPVPSTHPPVYPALVALTVTLFPDEIASVKIANGVLFAVCVVLLFYLFRRLGGDPHLAFVASVAVALNGHLLRLSTIMMSEIPFLLSTTAALAFFLHTRSSSLTEQLRRPHLYLFLFCLVLSCYIRTAGLSLLMGILLVLLLRRDWRYLLLVLTVFVLAMLPWRLRSQQIGESSYLSQFVLINPYQPELGYIDVGGLISRYINNAGRYISQEIPRGCLSFLSRNHEYPGWFEYIIGVLLIAVMAWGVYRLSRGRDIVMGYLAGTFVVLFGWPEVWTGARFLVPVVPLLLFCLANGLWAMISLLRQRLSPGLSVHPLMLLLLIWPFAGEVSALREQANQPLPTGWQTYREMARWAGQNLPEDALVSCRKPYFFRLYARRHVTVYNFISDTDKFIDDLDRRQVTHVVLDNLGFSSTIRYLHPAVLANMEMFRVIHRIQNPDTILLEFRRDADF